MFIHNRYRQPGGEDEVVEREKKLLRQAGHDVVEYTRENREIDDYGFAQKVSLVFRTTWAWDTHREVTDLLHREKPDLAHCHNTFPLLSPAVYYACKNTGVPVVQTLHNP
ncbi:MAG TPA: glycosyltransferase, partial [Ktedonobacteraceae bacterium]|nr:glycosyltransferase [Ktedonobacteraceae bacterium]